MRERIATLIALPAVLVSLSLLQRLNQVCAAEEALNSLSVTCIELTS